MPIRSLNNELQTIAIQQLNEDVTRIEETLEQIREWIQKQPHLIVRMDDQNLIRFLRSSKWSIERTKERIDRFYTARTLYPDFFLNRDPFSHDIQKVLKAGIICPLPSKDGSSPKIFFLKLSNIDANETPIIPFTKVVLMFLDILMHEDDRLNISGVQLIADFKGIPLNYTLQVSPKVIGAFLMCLLNVYPIRFNNLTGINIPDIFEKLLNAIFNASLNEKSRKKMVFYGSDNSGLLNTKIDKSLLPAELGGTNGSLTGIAEQWKAKVESYSNWYMEDGKYCSNENLRIGNSKYQNEFGVDGTFRKLNVD